VDSGKKAIKTCEKSPFDLALIDIELPDMKGTGLLHRLKRLQPKMIRITITGHPTLESAMKAVNERADGYMLNSIEVAKLLEMTNTQTSGNSRQSHHERPARAMLRSLSSERSTKRLPAEDTSINEAGMIFFGEVHLLH
jgi:DNA-binding NtrC family response regulator